MTASEASATATLPEFLRPKSGAPLIRLGRDRDGGYLVDRRTVEACDLLISMGINADWSFEEQFLNLRDIQLFGYDASISSRRFAMESWKRAAFLEPKNALQWLRTLRRYRTFFNGTNRVHRAEFVGFDYSDRYVSLKTLLSRDCGDAKDIFFKIDIEGSEYRLLDDLIACAPRITGLAIEFHDVDLHLERIRDFFEVFPLAVCHVHGNNFAPINPTGIPQAIEVSFTSAPVGEPLSVGCLPHELDRPSNPRRPDIALTFSE